MSSEREGQEDKDLEQDVLNEAILRDRGRHHSDEHIEGRIDRDAGCLRCPSLLLVLP